MADYDAGDWTVNVEGIGEIVNHAGGRDFIPNRQLSITTGPSGRGVNFNTQKDADTVNFTIRVFESDDTGQLDALLDLAETQDTISIFVEVRQDRLPYYGDKQQVRFGSPRCKIAQSTPLQGGSEPEAGIIEFTVQAIGFTRQTKEEVSA